MINSKYMVSVKEISIVKSIKLFIYLCDMGIHYASADDVIELCDPIEQKPRMHFS